jgi:hypothetical protein
MKTELIEKKQNLENELLKVNSQINLEIIREDLEELQKITDQLNSLFHNKIVKKYGDGYLPNNKNASDLINHALGILDEASVQLEEEISEIVNELNSETEKN